MCECVRTYLPNYGYLSEKTSSANKKYTYRKIDTHYCGQTASTTPSGVKAYVAQSNPLHFWVTCDKNRNFHLTHGTYPWHICKISPITKVHYLLEFCKKTPVNNQPVKNLTPAEKILPEKKKICPRKFLNFCPRKKKVTPRKNSKMCPRKLQTAREIFKKSGREKQFSPEKKTKKSTKNRFLGHFSFSRVKKKHCSRGTLLLIAAVF